MNFRYLIPRQFVGLYISSDFVEVAVIKRDINGSKIEKVVRRKIALSDVDISDQNEIIRTAVDDIFVEHKLPRGHVALNLPTNDVIVRTFKMPRLPQEEWGEAIRFEGQKYVPFRLEEMISDFCVLDPDEETAEMHILFVCTRSSVVSRYNTILSTNGIICQSLSSVFISMHKVVQYLNVLDEETPTLIVSVRKKVFGRERIRCVADMVVVWKGVPVVARDVSVMGSEADVDDKFFNEVYLSVKLFNSALSDSHIEKVLFLDGASLYKWDEFFNENFSCRIEEVSLSDMFGIEPTDGVALGAVLPTEILPRVDINLFDDSGGADVNALPPFSLKKVAMVEVVIALVLILASFVVYLPKIRAVDRQIKNLKGSAGAFAKESEMSLRKKKRSYEEMIKGLMPYKRERLNVGGVIQGVSDVFSADEHIWMEYLEVQDENADTRRIRIYGVAANDDLVKDMLLINDNKSKISELEPITERALEVDLSNVVSNSDNGRTNKEYTEFTLDLQQKKKQVAATKKRRKSKK